MKKASLIASHSRLFYSLAALSFLLILVLLGTTVQARAQVNLFSRDIARQWTTDTLLPNDAACPPGAPSPTLMTMQKALNHAGSKDPHSALHRGELSCLRGKVTQAEDIWQGGMASAANDPVLMLFATTASFAEGKRLAVTDTSAVGDFATVQGDAKKKEEDMTTAVDWYEMAFAYTPTAKVAGKLAAAYQALEMEEKAAQVWSRLMDSTTPQSPDYWWAAGHIQEQEKQWLEAFDAYLKAGDLETNPATAQRYYLRAGKMANRAKANNQAMEAYLRSIAMRPDRVQGYLNLGQIHLAQQDYENAQRWFEKARSVAPDNSTVYYYLAQTARQQQQYAEALALFDKALELKPDSAVALYEKAITLDKMNRRQEASRYLDQAIRVSKVVPENWQELLNKWLAYPVTPGDTGSDPDTWWAKAKEAEKAKDWARAAELYHKGAVIAHPPDDIKFLEREALMYRYLKEWDKAAAIYEDLIQRYPDDLNAYLGRGEVARAQKAYDEAAQWFSKAQAVAPEDYRPLYYLGQVALAQERYDEALAYFDQSLELKPENASALYYKATALDKLKRRAEAIEILSQAIDLTPSPSAAWQQQLEQWQRYANPDKSPDTFLAMGREAEKEKDWAKAADLYQQGADIAQPPDDYKLLSREALMYRYLKEWDKAAAIYEDLIQRYPDKLDAYLGRGEVARAQKAYEEAIQWYDKARDVAPDNYRPPYYLGLVARAQERYDEALAYFDQSLELKPDNPSMLYQKAVTLKTMGRLNDAITQLQQAIDLHKNPPQSWQDLLAKWQAEQG